MLSMNASSKKDCKIVNAHSVSTIVTITLDISDRVIARELHVDEGAHQTGDDFLHDCFCGRRFLHDLLAGSVCLSLKYRSLIQSTDLPPNGLTLELDFLAKLQPSMNSM